MSAKGRPKFSFEEGEPVVRQDSLWDQGEPVGPLLRSAAEGHTGGISEPLISALKAMGHSPYPFSAGDDLSLTDALNDAMATDVAQRQAWKEAHPYQDMGAQFAGAMIPSPANVPARIFKGAVNAPRALGVLGAAQKLPKPIRKLPLKMTESVVGGLGVEGVRQAVQKPTGFLNDKNMGEDLASTAAFSAALPIAGKALKKAWDGMKWMRQASFHSLFGVTEHNVNAYKKMPLDIEETAPSLADIKQRVDIAVLDLSKDFENAKITAAQAEEAFKAFKINLTNRLNEELHNAKEAAATAKEMLADAYAKTIDSIKSVPKPDYMAPQIMEAAENLKKQVIQASIDATDKLPDNAFTVKDDILKFINAQIQSLAPFGDKNNLAINSLEKFKNQIIKYPGDVPPFVSRAKGISNPRRDPQLLSAKTIKNIIKGLQRDYIKTAGPAEFPEPARLEKYVLSGKINKLLKEAFPEYAEAMVPTARKTSILSEFNKKLKTEPAIASKLGSNHIKTRAGAYDLKVIEDLEREMGADLLTPIKQYLAAQGLLDAEKSTGVLKKGLPEYSKHVKAGQEVQKRSGFLKKKSFDSQVNNSKELADLKAAQATLATAKNKAAVVHGLGERQTSGAIKGVTAGTNRISNKKRLQELGDAVGEKFVKEIEDREVLESFKRNATRGSRNVNQGAFVGAAIGFFSLAGHGVMSAIGGAVGGAATGGTFARTVLDEYGPDVAKRILYSAKKAKQEKSLKAIQNANIPSKVKLDLETAFKYWMVKESEKQGVIFERDKPKSDAKSRLKALGG